MMKSPTKACLTPSWLPPDIRRHRAPTRCVVVGSPRSLSARRPDRLWPPGSLWPLLAKSLLVGLRSWLLPAVRQLAVFGRGLGRVGGRLPTDLGGASVLASVRCGVRLCVRRPPVWSWTPVTTILPGSLLVTGEHLWSL